MKLRIASIAMLVALIGAFAIAPLSADAKKGGSLPIGDTVSLDGNTTLENLTITHFSNQGGTLLAHGTTLVSNEEFDVDGVSSAFTSEITNAYMGSEAASSSGVQLLAQQASCGILYLEINEIFLDLLGLQVAIDPIIIDISAVPGAGNLLGNLLCAVAGLLDGPGPLGSLAGLLNNILRNLGLAA